MHRQLPAIYYFSVLKRGDKILPERRLINAIYAINS